MENRDRDKMSDINRGISKDQSKSESSVEFGQKIGQSEKPLKGESGRSSADLESAALGASGDKEKSSTWGDSGKSSQGGNRQ